MARRDRKSGVAPGYTLVELVVAMFLAIVVLGGVFGLLNRSQRSFARETKVAEVNHSLNAALEMIGRDLTSAGYKTPPSATVWAQEGSTSDQLTAVYADNEIPTIVRPLRCTDDAKGNPCQDLAYLSSLLVDAENLNTAQRGLEKAYNRGNVLLAVERTDCNQDEMIGILPLDLTSPPTFDETGNYIEIGIRAGDSEELNLPFGYNDSVYPDCAEIGDFRVVQYRVALDDKSIPTLERRDYSQMEPWIPVAADVGVLDVELYSAFTGTGHPNTGPQQQTIGRGGGGGRSSSTVRVTLRGSSYVGAGGSVPFRRGTALTVNSSESSQTSSQTSPSSTGFSGGQGRVPNWGGSSTQKTGPSQTTSEGAGGSGSLGTGSTTGEQETPSEEEAPAQTTVTTTVTLRNTETYYNSEAPLSGSRQLAALPVIPDISCGPSNGNTLRVSQGGDFQDALNRAQPGDTILLEAGASFMGSFILPKKNGDACITIRSSARDDQLPPSDTRVTPADRRFLPKIVSPGSNQSALKTAEGAHHYKFIAVEFAPAAGEYIGDLVNLGSADAKEESQLAHHLEFDRVYIHGDPKVGGKRGVALNSGATTIKNSYISDFKSSGQDSQAICGWNGSGPFRIVNNYLEGAAENVLFGGADPRIRDLVPADIEILGNHVKKPLAWKEDDPSYDGSSWSIKNLLELKNARRVLIDGNVFENNWAQSQVGFAMVLKSTNQSGTAPWSVTEDVTISNNIIRRSTNGINMCGACPGEIPASRITITNNVFEDIGAAEWQSPGGWLFQVLRGVDDIVVEHNTFTNAVSSYGMISADGSPPNENFVFQDNIVPNNRYGVKGAGKGGGTATLDAFFPASLFRRNVIVGGIDLSAYPPDNFLARSFHDVGFLDPPRDYRLAASSKFKNAGTDGNDVGANIDVLEEATNGVIQGIR